MKAHWNTPAYFESAAAADIVAELERGAGPKARDRGGATPLRHAMAWNDDPAVIEALPDAGADPPVMDTWGRTPRDRARLNNAIKGSSALRRLRPDDRVNTE